MGQDQTRQQPSNGVANTSSSKAVMDFYNQQACSTPSSPSDVNKKNNNNNSSRKKSSNNDQPQGGSSSSNKTFKVVLLGTGEGMCAFIL